MLKNVIRSRASLSLPGTRKVRGYEIKRLPLGGYVAALQKLQDLPQNAMTLMFPGLGLDAVIEQLKSVTTESIVEITVRMVSVLPKQAASLLAALTDIPEDALLNDPAVGLDGLAEIAEAWLDINNIGNFITAARGIREKLRTQAAANTSSKS